jgi:hypothetical protein
MGNYKWSEAFERLPIGTVLRRKSDGRVMMKVDHHSVLSSGEHEPMLFKYLIGPLQALDELFEVECSALPPAKPPSSDDPTNRSSAFAPANAKKPLDVKTEPCPDEQK